MSRLFASLCRWKMSVIFSLPGPQRGSIGAIAHSIKMNYDICRIRGKAQARTCPPMLLSWMPEHLREVLRSAPRPPSPKLPGLSWESSPALPMPDHSRSRCPPRALWPHMSSPTPFPPSWPTRSQPSRGAHWRGGPPLNPAIPWRPPPSRDLWEDSGNLYPPPPPGFPAAPTPTAGLGASGPPSGRLHEAAWAWLGRLCWSVPGLTTTPGLRVAMTESVISPERKAVWRGSWRRRRYGTGKPWGKPNALARRRGSAPFGPPRPRPQRRC